MVQKLNWPFNLCTKAHTSLAWWNSELSYTLYLTMCVHVWPAMYTSVNATQQCLSVILSSCLHVRNHCPALHHNANIYNSTDSFCCHVAFHSIPPPPLFFCFLSSSGTATYKSIITSVPRALCRVRLKLPIMPQSFMLRTKVLQKASVSVGTTTHREKRRLAV